jgi:hypothetical protein
MAMATLSIPLDEESIQRARLIAASRNMTVEAYIERLIRVVTQPTPKPDELGPLTRKLGGILPPMTDDEIRNTISDALAQKHGDAEAAR